VNCQDVIRELSEYLDGELSPEARRELEEHLRDCRECQLVVDQTRMTVEIFCDSQPVPLPQDVQMRLREALRRNYSGKRA
jgi:anti-sigma factor RsiW